MKQLAWLFSRPRQPGAKPDPDAPPPPTRLEEIEKDGGGSDLPELSPFLFEDPLLPVGQPVLVDWLIEIGPTESGAMGASVLSWREIRAWQYSSGIPLAPWQARLIRRLSRDWINQSEEARKWDCPAPYATGESARSRGSAISDRIRQAFGAPPRKAKRG